MKLRIAPSPTGELHIGNARTALFNWLYARKNNGKFLLRIDDTDTERSTPEYIENIVQNLSWLGIDWDEGYELSDSNSYKQSDRFGRYEEVVNQLLKNDFAYEDDGAVRFRVEKDKELFFQDYVRGDMKFNTNDVEDFVILRSDKSPTYHLASTVDDIDYEITIIARGEDILSSTPKHIMIMNALNAEVPDFCHLPLLFGPDGKKLSKRHGDTSVSSFRERGVFCLVLNVCYLNGDSSFFFFWCFINFIESSCLTRTSISQNFCYCGRQCCFSMVNVAHCTNVHMRLASVKFLF